MANCKICGEPVRCARVFHAACWETAAKRELAAFCDHDCRWPRECGDEESLRELRRTSPQSGPEGRTLHAAEQAVSKSRPKEEQNT